MAVAKGRAVGIPPELAGLVADKRLIPFVGAGFSAALGMPTWDALLRRVADQLDDNLTYDQIRQFANNDNLQIAEYLYLKAFRRVGPLRHEIESLTPNANPVTSGAHVELVNLGAPQIYTTNYDDLIEKTFRGLARPVNVVTLPRDVATARADVTQVVKYHGDLRHDETLVLTESSYYRRLDFESPMDLKFRSDLLGRAVLFIGYSFRDINIRIIWWKLMQMMTDIPEADRWPSYIVRLEQNPVLEELDRAVGLRTLVLDPEGSAVTDDARAELMAAFLYDLATAATTGGEIPGTKESMFVSSHILSEVEDAVARHEDRFKSGEDPYIYGFRADSSQRAAAMLANRQIPAALMPRVEAIYRKALALSDNGTMFSLVLSLHDRFPASAGLTASVGHAMTRGILRASIRRKERDWSKFWESRVSLEHAIALVNRLDNELQYHLASNVDDDLAYAIDIVDRLRIGEIFDIDSHPEIAERIDTLMSEVAELYPSAKSHRPNIGGAPDVTELLVEFATRRESEDLNDEPF